MLATNRYHPGRGLAARLHALRAVRQRIGLFTALCLLGGAWLPVWAEPAGVRFSDRPAQPAAEEILPVPAPEPGLSLADLERMALAAHPALLRASAQVGAARGRWIEVGLPPNPLIGYQGQQLGSGGRSEEHGVLFRQEIVRGGKLGLNRAVAEQELVAARQQLALRQQRLLTDVRLAYFQVLTAQRQIDLSLSLVEVGRRSMEAVDSLLRAQEAGRVEVIQAELELENALILLHQSRRRHDAAWRELAAAVGNPSLPPQPLAGDAFAPAKDLDYQAVLERVLRSSPEIAAAAVEIDRARLALERARAEPIPNLHLEGLVNWQDNGDGGRPNGSLAVALPIPLYHRHPGLALRAEHELIAAQQALQQLELELQSRLARVFERYATARFQVERYQARLLPAARESLDLIRERYEAGESGFLEPLNAQRTYAQTHLNYLEAIRGLRSAEVELEGLLPGDLR